MDEKTEQLRDIFVDVAGEETLTERQERARGSLADDGSTDERLGAVVEAMRERYDLRTSLSTDELVAVARGFYAGRNDTEIARELGDDVRRETVSRARIDLHLVTDRDRDAPFDLGELRDLLAADRSVPEIADELGASESTVRRYRHVVETEEERRMVSDRFRTEFDRLLADSELAERLAAESRESGLEDATEGMESNVQF